MKLELRNGRSLRPAVVVGATAIVTAATLWLGMAPLQSAFLRLEGHVLTVDSTIKEVVVQEAGATATARFPVHNIADRPLTIYGASTNCGCAVVTNLPVTIPAGQTKTLIFQVTTSPDQAGQFITQEARLFVDLPSPPITLQMKVRVGS